MARAIQLDAESAPALRLTVDKLEMQLVLRGERLSSCKESINHSRFLIVQAETKVIEIKRKYEAWYYKPAVWVGVGAVLVVIIEVAAVASLNALK